MSDLTALNDWYERFHEECRRADALAAELSEVREGLASIFANLDDPEKHSIFDSFAHEDGLRNLAAQPQGGRGKALLAVVEAARRVTVGGPPDGCGLCQHGTCRAPAHNALTARLAAIDGAQPE